MPLPTTDTPWPPPEHAQRYADMAKALPWLVGDAAQLGGAVSGTQVPNVSGKDGRTWAARLFSREEMFGAQNNDVTRPRLHAPIGEDIARTKAILVYGERVRYVVDGERQTTDGPVVAGQLDEDGQPMLAWRKGDPTPETAATQEALDQLLDRVGLESQLLGACEIGTALGSYALRIAVDKARFPKHPLIVTTRADAVIPEYEWGQLTAVTFWRVVEADGQRVLRHLERHEYASGTVEHGLYQGDGRMLGQQIPLVEHPSTAPLAPLVDAQARIRVAGEGTVTAVSIPNALPDASNPANLAGRTDFTPSVIGLMAAADDFYNQLMQSLDDGQSRLLVAEYLTSNAGKGKGLRFDRSTKLFTQLSVPVSDDQSGKLPIEQIQFDLRVAEYLLGYQSMRELAIQAAGYNPQTMGDTGDVQQTATEYAGKNKRSLATRDSSIRHAKNPLGDIVTGLLRVYVEQFAPRAADGTLVKAFPVHAEFPESVQPSAMELFSQAKALMDSGGSVEEVVKATYPDMGDDQVRVLAAKRKAETQSPDPVSFGGGGFGVGEGDGA
jgi:hypothetical protein